MSYVITYFTGPKRHNSILIFELQGQVKERPCFPLREQDEAYPTAGDVTNQVILNTDKKTR